MTVWLFHLDLYDIREDRDEIVKRIREQKFYARPHDGPSEELAELIEELADAANEEEFDAAWMYFYEYCDVERIWVNTMSPMRKENDEQDAESQAGR